MYCSVIPVNKPCHATRTELKRQNIVSPLNAASSASLFLNASHDRELITSHVMKCVCLDECGGYSLHREKQFTCQGLAFSQRTGQSPWWSLEEGQEEERELSTQSVVGLEQEACGVVQSVMGTGSQDGQAASPGQLTCALSHTSCARGPGKAQEETSGILRLGSQAPRLQKQRQWALEGVHGQRGLGCESLVEGLLLHLVDILLLATHGQGLGGGGMAFTSLRDYVQSSLLLPALTLRPLLVERSPFQTEGAHPVVYQFSARNFRGLGFLKKVSFQPFYLAFLFCAFYGLATPSIVSGKQLHHAGSSLEKKILRLHHDQLNQNLSFHKILW